MQVEQKISASYVSAQAKTVSTGSGVHLRGNSHVAGLEINGTPMLCTGEPNQIVWLPLGTGKVIINEQIRFRQGSHESITVNALHVIIPGTVDLVVASDRADATDDHPSQMNTNPPIG